MGQFTMVIHGTGAHHNWNVNERGYIEGRKNDYDADLLFAEFVDLLKSKGHNITGATLTYGCMQGAESVVRQEMPRGFKPADFADVGPVEPVFSKGAA